MLTGITLHRRFARAVVFGLAAGWLLLLAADAHASREEKPVPTTEEWQRSIRDRGLDPHQVVNPLGISEEMRRLAQQAVGQRSPREQLAHLQRFLFDPDRFTFDYEARGTYTAEEAFARRQGNCVSFTNMFIALGRSLGVPLEAALIRRGDSELDGDLVVVNTHMVAVHQHSDGATIYDFSRSENKQLTGMWVMDDLWVTAVFLNNKGVEALRQGDHEAAIGQLRQAIRLTPDFTAAYANLGVAYRKARQPDQALEVYQQALAGEARDPTVLNNLASLLESLGRTEEAEAALRAASLRNATPFLLITRGDLEVSAGDPRQAEKLYHRARRTDPDLPDPHVALARLKLSQGQDNAARKLVRRALKLDPEHHGARRLAEKLGIEGP